MCIYLIYYLMIGMSRSNRQLTTILELYFISSAIRFYLNHRLTKTLLHSSTFLYLVNFLKPTLHSLPLKMCIYKDLSILILLVASCAFQEP